MYEKKTKNIVKSICSLSLLQKSLNIIISFTLKKRLTILAPQYDKPIKNRKF